MGDVPAGWSTEAAEQAAAPSSPAPIEAPVPTGWQTEGPPTAEAGAVDTFHGIAPSHDGEAMSRGVEQLLMKGVPRSVIRDYVSQSGSSLPKETADWLDNSYQEKPTRVVANVAKGEDVGAPTAAWRGLQSGALMGYDDELKAAAGTLGNNIGSLVGMNKSNMSEGDIYNHLLEQARGEKEAAYAQHPYAYGAGYIPGMALSAYVTRGRSPASESLWGRILQGGAEGAKQGAIVGSGNAEGGVGSRIMGALQGGAFGGPLGMVATPLGEMLGNVAGRLGGKLASYVRPASAEPGLDALAARAPVGPTGVDAMRNQLDRYTQAGVPARLADVVDESGRGVIRDAAGKMTPGREDVARHADDVYTSLQNRVGGQADKIIDSSPQTARELAQQIRGSKTLGGDNEAGVLMNEQMEPLRGKTVNIDDDMKGVLSTREGQAALRGAQGLMTDPADRAQAQALLGAAKQYAKGPVDVQDILRKEVPGWDDLPPKIKDAYMAQRPDLANQGDAFDGHTMTLDMADKFARAMKGRAMSTPGLENVANQFANTVRGSARAQIPEYDAALTQYANAQKVADAAEGARGSRYADSKFMSTAPDRYAQVVEGASKTPGTTTPEGQPGVSEAQALARRARDEIVDDATAGSGAGAAGVARQLARGSAQDARSTALLGPDKAAALKNNMEAELNRVENTRYIDPRIGSQTQSKGQDAIVDGFGTAIHAATGGKWAMAKIATNWLRAGGIKGVDAERLARDSISQDPARVKAAIDYLESKGMARARAQRFVSHYGGALAGRMGGGTVDDGSQAPPASALNIQQQ